MAQTIKLKRSAQAGNTPALNQLELGEIAINTADGKMFIKRDDGTSNDPTIVEVGSTGSFLPLSGGSLTGNLSLGDNVKAQFGAGNDLQIYHDGSNSIINDAGTGTIRIQTAGANQWEFNGLNFKGNDGRKIILGDSSDLQIYHDGSNSFISDTGTGGLNIRGSDFVKLQTSDGAETMLFAQANGTVQLKYDNSTKLATTATGADITGILTADGLTVSNNSGATLNINTAGGATDAKILLHETATATSEYGASLKYNGAYNRFEIGVGQDPETKRLSIDRDTGDISFYNSAGTSQSFYWDSSTSRLGLGTTAPSQALEIKRSGNNGNVALKIHNTGTATNDDALIGFLTEGNRNYSLGIHRDSGSFTLSNQDASVASGELLTIANSGNATFSGSVTANAGVVVDNITIDGNEIDLSSGDLTLDVAGKINLDHGSPEILLKDDGTHYASFISSNTDFVIQSILSDKDMLFKGQDGSSTITALTLDMSDAGSASFSNNVNIPNGGLMVGATSAPTSANSNGQTLVLSGSGNTGMSIVSGTSSNSSIMFADGYGGTAGYRGHIKYNHADDSLNFATAATANRLTIDSSGSVGIGVTPSAWADTSTALQIGSLALEDYTVSGANVSVFYNNAFRNTSGNIVYKETDFASTYSQYNGEHTFSVAPSGTAGATISLTQALKISSSANVNIPNGGLMVGSTTAPTGNFNSYISATRQITHNGNGGDLSVISDNNSSPVFYVKGTGNADLVNVFDNTTEVFKIADGGAATFSGSVTTGGTINNIQSTTGTGSSAVKNLIYNSGGGDSALQLSILGSIDYYLGVDNTDDTFKIGRASWDSSPYLSINSLGSVGIGTASPSAKLHVYEGSTTGVNIGIQNTERYWNIETNDGLLKFQDVTAGSLPRMVFDTNGNVNVYNSLMVGATTAPSAPLDVVTNSTVYAAEFTQSNTSNGDGVFISVGSTAAADYALTVRSDAGNTSVLAAKADGKVGIGTFTPSETLHLKSANPVIRLEDSNPNGIYAQIDGAGGSLILSADQGNGSANSSIVFKNDNTERMRIDSSGRVGIKTTPSAWTTDYAVLDLNTGGSIYGTTSGVTTASNLYFNGSSWLAKTTGLGTLYAQHSGTHNWYGSASVSAGSAAGLSTKMTLTADGTLLVGKTVTSLATAGIALMSNDQVRVTTASDNPLELNRLSNDGDIARFYQDTVQKGNISVSAYGMGFGGGTRSSDFFIKTDGTASFAGGVNLGVGRTPTQRLDVNGTVRVSDGTFGGYFGAGSGITNSGASTDFCLRSDAVLSFASGGPYERARIISSGEFLIGCTSAGDYGITLDGSPASNSTPSMELVRDFSGTATMIRFTNISGSPYVGSITSTTSATAYNTSSDERLKDNIKDADDSGSKVDAIQVRQFDWKADGEHQDYGMVAQELLEVAPDAVTKGDTPDDMMGVDYSKLVPMLIKEIQSLRQRVAQLEE